MDPQAVSAAERLVDHAILMLTMGECYCDGDDGCVAHDIMAVSAYVVTIAADAVERSRVGGKVCS
jgi:hypothetical protein